MIHLADIKSNLFWDVALNLFWSYPIDDFFAENSVSVSFYIHLSEIRINKFRFVSFQHFFGSKYILYTKKSENNISFHIWRPNSENSKN